MRSRSNHPLEQDIQRVLATIAAYSSQDEKPEEITEPLTTEQESNEPIETYHIYPTENGIFITKEEDTEQIIDTNPPHRQRPPLFPVICSILCSLAVIAFLVFLSTIPTTKQLTFTRSISLPVHILPPVVESRSETIVATGRGHQDATFAHGTITLYNGSFSEQLIPQNMLFTTANGVKIATDHTVTIPAGNPPNYGQTTVSAYAILPGSEGNIPAYSINAICCAESVKAVNTEAFRGGRNARDYMVVTATDISHAVPSLEHSLDTQVQTALQDHLTADQVFIPLPCSSTVHTNHHAGEEATSVIIQVSATCAAITYSQQSLQYAARQLVQIPTDFMLVSFQVHPINTTINKDHKSIIVTVAITTVLCYQQSVKPQVK